MFATSRSSPHAHADLRARCSRADAGADCVAGASGLPNDAGLVYKLLGMETEPVKAGKEADMPDERRHESADLEDYEVLDASDTLDGAPGDDPLDRGVVTPDRWSAAIRFGTTGEEQQTGESLDQALDEEEPDVTADIDDEQDEDTGPDENAPEQDVSRYLLDDDPDPRAGRLVDEDAEVYGAGDNYLCRP